MADVAQPGSQAQAVDAIGASVAEGPQLALPIAVENALPVQVNATSASEPVPGLPAPKKKKGKKAASLADSNAQAGESASKPSRNLVKWDSQPLRMLMLLNAEKALWDLVKDKNQVYTLLAKNVYGNLGEAPTPEATEQRFAKWRSELKDGGHIVPEMIDKRGNTCEFARQQRAEQSGKPAQQVAAVEQTQQQKEVPSTPIKSQRTTRGAKQAANRRNGRKASGTATSSGAGGAGDGDDSDDSDAGRRPPPNTPMGTPKRKKRTTKKRKVDDSDEEGCSPPLGELSSSDTSDGEFGVSLPKKRGKKRKTRSQNANRRPQADSDTDMIGNDQTGSGGGDYQSLANRNASQPRWGIRPRGVSRTPSVDMDNSGDDFALVGHAGPSEHHAVFNANNDNNNNNSYFPSTSSTQIPPGTPKRTPKMSDEPLRIGPIQASYMAQFKEVPIIAPENEPAAAHARQQSSDFITHSANSNRVMTESELREYLASRSRRPAQPLATGQNPYASGASPRTDSEGFKVPNLPASAARQRTQVAAPKRRSKIVVLKINFDPLHQASQVPTGSQFLDQPKQQHTDQVVDEPPSQTLSQIIEQPYKQEFNQAVDQPFEQGLVQATDRPHVQTFNQAIDEPTHELSDAEEDQAVNQLSDQTVSMAINNDSQETGQDNKDLQQSVQGPLAGATTLSGDLKSSIGDANLYATAYPNLDNLPSAANINDFDNAFMVTEPHSYLDDYMEYGGGDLGYDPFAGEEDPTLKFELRDLGFPIAQDSIYANTSGQQMQQVPATAGMTAPSTGSFSYPFNNPLTFDNSFNPSVSSSQSAAYVPNSVPVGDVNDFKEIPSIYGGLVGPFSDMPSFIDTNVPAFHAHGAFLLPAAHPWAIPHASNEKKRTQRYQDVAAHLDRLGNYKTNFPLAGAWLQEPHNSDVFVFVAGFNNSWESVRKEVVRRPLHYFETTNQWYDSTTGEPKGVYGVPSPDEYDHFGLFGAAVSLMARNGLDWQPPFPDAGVVARNMGLGVGGDAPGRNFPPVPANLVLRSTHTPPPS